MAQMTKETRAKILGYIDKVAENISDGNSPNDAIVKVARDHDVEPGHIQLMVQAYNNSRANQQRTSSSELQEKLAGFELADLKTIAQTLYPQNVKAAEARQAINQVVSADYSLSPVAVRPNHYLAMTKAAALILTPPKTFAPPDRDRYIKRAWSLLKELDNQQQEHRRAVSSCRDKIAMSFHELETYFKSPGQPVQFKEAMVNSIATYGQPAKTLFEHVAKGLPAHLTKEAKCALLPAVNPATAPFSLVRACLQKIAEYHQLKNTLDTFNKEAAIASDRLLQVFMPLIPRKISGSIAKQANTLEDAASWAGKVVDKSPFSDVLGGLQPKPSEKLKTDAFYAVNDPAHEAKMRGVRSQAMLTNMMANDEFLSGEDPGKVTKLYNQIVQAAPRSADQPLLMQSLLRRYLGQGLVDPHDVDQLMGVENKLRDSRQPAGAYNLPKLPGSSLEGPAK